MKLWIRCGPTAAFMITSSTTSTTATTASLCSKTFAFASFTTFLGNGRFARKLCGHVCLNGRRNERASPTLTRAHEMLGSFKGWVKRVLNVGLLRELEATTRNFQAS